MSDFELSGLVDFDVSELTGGTEDATDSLEGLADESDDASESLFEIDAAGAAAGGALAGLGAGMQKAMDDTQDLREELNRAGQAAGFTQDEMVDLATGLSDATFSTEDATGALGALAEQGVDTEAELKALAETSDDIADATGESATVVAEDLGPAMAAVGDDISEMDEIADGVVATINETNLEFNDFTRTVERSREELNEMGLSTDETATLMGEFAEETGLSGQELRREFSSDLEDADGDLAAFADSTGLNIDNQADLQAALEDSQGATDSYSDAVSENTTLMDELRVGVSDATLQFADMLGPVSAAAPALQGLGVAAITLSTINFSAVVPSLAAVSAAAAPITAVVLGLAAAAAILWKAWESNFLGIQNVTEDVFGALTDGIEWYLGFISDSLSFVIDSIMQIPEVLGGVIDAIPGIDSEDVLGRVDTEGLADSLFPDKPGEEGEDVGEAMGEGASEGLSDASPSPEAVAPDLPGAGEVDAADPDTAETPTDVATDSEDTDSTATASSPDSGGGGLSASKIREALEGMALSLSGELPIDGDVATMDDVEARLRAEGRRQA